jgi:hypothetical protein
LPLFKRGTVEVGALLPRWYLHGLARFRIGAARAAG